jgi:predicted DNA-binding transcriptional regulator YafY
MPSNKHAAIRYRVIDRQLVQRKFPTLDDLATACEKALPPEKKKNTVGTRTISKDIEDMRHNEELGFNAPIVYDRDQRGYVYEDPHYSITKFPLNKEEMKSLSFVANLLDQYRDIELFDTYIGAVEKVVNAIRVGRLRLHYPKYNFIGFEKIPKGGGTEFLNPLIETIIQKYVVEIQYQRFEREKPLRHLVHPYYLKEYRNRWYLIGWHDKYNELRTYALDRVKSVEARTDRPYIEGYFDPDEYFKNSVGIIARLGDPVTVRLRFTRIQGDYVLTQPIHSSQVVEKQTEEYTTIKLCVGISYELTSSIVSWGDQVKVLAPKSLKDEIRKIHKNAFDLYEQ